MKHLFPFDFEVDWMTTILAVGLLLVIWSFIRAHRRPGIDFSLYDLILENGKVSKIAFTFMAAFAVTSWILIDLQLKGKMTEGYLTVYGAMWVASLMAKVLSNKQGPSVTDSDIAQGGK